MNNENIFNSLSTPVPPVRRELQLIPIKNNGESLLYFHDSLEYMPSNFALDQRVEPVLTLLNGNLSCNQISEMLNNQIKATEVLNFAQLLDESRALYSQFYKSFSNQTEVDFENNKIRPPAFSGDSYPSESDDMITFLEEIFSEVPSNGKLTHTPKALYAPHIDLKVGSKQYAEAFHLIKHLRPKRVVLLATSHYSGYYKSLYDDFPFIGSEKTFQLPGREFKPDLDTIRHFKKSSPNNGFTTLDRAHRIEHSIELHLLFAGAIWPHEIEIVPILIGSLDELYYHPSGELAEKCDLFSQQLQEIDDPETFFLISGDLSHVGKKFGDSTPASSLRNDVEISDKTFIDIAEKGDQKKLLRHISKDFDSTRICGFPPLYTFLNSFPGIEGKSLNYHWWDEKERESAVSFGTVIY